MRYIPATNRDVANMLEAIGVSSIEELFTTVPEGLQLGRALNVPPSHSEFDVMTAARQLSEQNRGAAGMISYLGGGAYNHYIPTVVDTILSRSEFATAYTPYQAEVAQGTLQAIFQMQTYVCELFGMEVANASNYEGASALAEAALMSLRMRRRYKGPMRILVSQAVNPEYRLVLKTYLKHSPIEVVEVPYDRESGATLWSDVKRTAEGGAISIVTQSPNYFGVVEDLAQQREVCDGADAAMIVAVAEPMSLGLLKPPGDFGADIVVGEGQSMGISLTYGGPYLGLFAAKKKYLRSLPGRLVGQTKDADGERGYVLTLSTREQHIRREKATSNICTNAGLMALGFTVFTSLIGKVGLQSLSRLNLDKATWMKGQVANIPGLKLAFNGPSFNEFTVESTRIPVKQLMSRLEDKGIIAGIPLSELSSELDDAAMDNRFLMAVTEMQTRPDMDKTLAALREVTK